MNNFFENQSSDLELVSIIVLTYNSSEFISETLESIRNQTYSNIELIITDDFSKDNTVNICEDWLEIYSYRFNDKVKIIKSSYNTGISCNLNRGLEAASGKWIKPMAGDDTLFDDGINSFVDFCKNSDAKIAYSSMSLITSNINFKEKFEGFFKISREIQNNHFNAEYQNTILQYYNFIMAPSAFYNKIVVSNLGGACEDFKFIDDWPLWLKATSQGFKIHYIDKPLINYRIHDQSIQMSHKFNASFEFFRAKELLRVPFTFIYKYVNQFNINKCHLILLTLLRLLTIPYVIIYKIKKIRLRRKITILNSL